MSLNTQFTIRTVRNLLFTVVISLIFSCTEQNEKAYSFYYWRTNLSLTPKEKQVAEASTAPYIYVRFFDVDKTDTVFQPVAIITKDTSFNINKKIVPVIYITNKCFINVTQQQIKFLAENVYALINKKITELQLNNSDEIQIDCDWTKTTKDNYFTFLQELQKISKQQITSTLRLHQVKHKTSTGVPPVKKVYLMCYATSSPLETNDKNSILDIPTLKNYLNDVEKYPLQIDIALPVYSWAIVTNHVGKHKLINGVAEKDIKSSNFKQVNKNTFEVLNAGFYFNVYLSKGFMLQLEEISEQQLSEAKTFLKNKIKNYNIVYYHLDERFIAQRKF